MDYKKCFLYGLKSKKQLLKLLHIDRKVYCKNSFVNCKIKPYIDIDSKNHKRLIEAPDDDLKKIQSLILKALQALDIPEYVYSGVRGRCYIDNAKAHSNKSALFKIDISKFFPNTCRDKIYKFYLNKLHTSPDVANILTNFSTINLDLKNQENRTMQLVNLFISEKGITNRNHLITGSPLSSIMSYLANADMFEYLYSYSRRYGITMTVYVDDIVFSANHKIPSFFRNYIIKVIQHNGYIISPKKCKWYNYPAIKKVTGVILDESGKMQVPNRLMQKTHAYIEEIKQQEMANINKLQGCLIVVNTISGKLRAYNGQIKKYIKKSYHAN